MQLPESVACSNAHSCVPILVRFFLSQMHPKVVQPEDVPLPLEAGDLPRMWQAQDWTPFERQLHTKSHCQKYEVGSLSLGTTHVPAKRVLAFV